MANYLSTNSEILDKTYDTVVSSATKSNSKVDKLVTCLQSDKRIIEESLEKENIDNNSDNMHLVKTNEIEEIKNKKIIEEEVVLPKYEHFHLSKTPKNGMNDLKHQIKMNSTLEDELLSGLESYVYQFDFPQYKKKTIFSSLSYPPAKGND